MPSIQIIPKAGACDCAGKGQAATPDMRCEGLRDTIRKTSLKARRQA